MLTSESILIDSKPNRLNATDYVIRKVSPDDDEDSGWRFQAIIKNTCSSTLTDLQYALRYYTSDGRFIGLDEGFTLGSDELGRQEDKSVSIDLNIPPGTGRAVFALKARRTNFLERHNFLIFAAALLLAGLLFFISDRFK